MRKLFFLFLALVATTSLWAQRFQVGDLYYNITSSSEPYTVEVTYLYDWSETNYSSLTSVVIPESVTRNGTIYSVTSIGDHAFLYCQGLTSITIPKSVTSIGEMAFSSCDSLTSITIHESITSIGEMAFAYCRNMKSVVWNAINCADFSYRSAEGPFGDQHYNSAITSFTFGDSVQHIPAYLCYGMTKLTSVTIPNSVTSIGSGAFEGCSGLKSPAYNAHCFAYMPTSYQGDYVIPEGIKQIAGSAFRGCVGLTSVTIPNSLTSIGDFAFYECSSLTSVTTGNGLTSIGDYAFDGCSGLTSITIPNSVTSIGECAFYGCSGLKSINIPNSLTSIERHTFDGCSSLTSITIPNSVTSIGYSAFSRCSGLTSVTIGNSVESIDYYAFRECSNLGKIILGSSLKEISPYAFEECRKLIRIYCYAVYPPEADENSFANYNGYLYAPCDNLEEYSTNIVFGSFKNFECISSDEVSTDEDEVVVDPGTNDATISWPTEEDAETYSIVIYKDGEVFCTLTFNSNGQLVNIAFAPGRRGNHPIRYAEATANGYQFTVTGLDESTEYGYNLDVKDDSSKTIKSYSGEFTTQSTTAVDNITTNNANIQKIMRDGQLIIIRNGVEYNAVGQEM